MPNKNRKETLNKSKNNNKSNYNWEQLKEHPLDSTKEICVSVIDKGNKISKKLWLKVDSGASKKMHHLLLPATGMIVGCIIGASNSFAPSSSNYWLAFLIPNFLEATAINATIGGVSGLIIGFEANNSGKAVLKGKIPIAGVMGVVGGVANLMLNPNANLLNSMAFASTGILTTKAISTRLYFSNLSRHKKKELELALIEKEIVNKSKYNEENTSLLESERDNWIEKEKFKLNKLPQKWVLPDGTPMKGASLSDLTQECSKENNSEQTWN